MQHFHVQDDLQYWSLCCTVHIPLALGHCSEKMTLNMQQQDFGCVEENEEDAALNFS